MKGRSGRGSARGQGRHSSWDAYHEDPRLRDFTPDVEAELDNIVREIANARPGPENPLHEPGGLKLAELLFQQGIVDGRVLEDVRRWWREDASGIRRWTKSSSCSTSTS